MIPNIIMSLLLISALGLLVGVLWLKFVAPRRAPIEVYRSLREHGYTNQQIRQQLDSARNITESDRKIILGLTERNQ